MKFFSPLRYPGGKGRLADFVKQVFRDNLLCGGCYVEPYAGGASVALSLLFSGCASNVVINDVDRAIYAFWHSIINKTEEFCERVKKATMDVPTWRSQQRIQRSKGKASLLDLGFATFYLNRTNRSGILGGGVIGGLDQEGAWKMDARFNKDELVERIQKIAKHKTRIKLYNLDACKLINQLASLLPEKTVFYLDPPYYVKGQDLYVNYYQPKDHDLVAKTTAKLKKHHWIVSYDNVPPICRLYKSFRKIRYSIKYSADKSRMGNEVMFFSHALSIPRKKAPNGGELE